MRNVPSEWVQDLPAGDRGDYAERLKHVSDLFDKLRGMIQKRYDAALAANEIDYDNSSWAHKQAHRNGKLEALEEIYKLLP